MLGEFLRFPKLALEIDFYIGETRSRVFHELVNHSDCFRDANMVRLLEQHPRKRLDVSGFAFSDFSASTFDFYFQRVAVS